MLNSTKSTGSTNGSPPDFNQQLSPADNGSLPIEFPLTPQGSSAPTEGQNSPPPESSTATPPPDGPSSTSSPPPPDSTSSPPSPPSDSNSSSPPSDSGPSPPAPPPDSNSSVPSPPSGSDSSPPPLPQDSSSSSPPPLASPAPDSPASHPPPTVPGQSSSPPSITPPSSANSPPPPNSPPAESVPAPVASNGPAPPLAGNSGSPTPPPVQTASPTLPKSPPIAVPSPQVPGSPSEPSTNNPTPSNEVPPSTLTPPTSRSPQFPKLSPPSTSSDSNSSSTSSKSSGSSGGGPVIGVTLAGVVVIALVALFFIVVRRRKKQAEAFAARYKPTPNSFSGQLDGYYHSQQHTHQLMIGGSGRSDLYFGTKPPSSPSAFGNGYGSHRGFSSGAPESSVMGAKSWFSYEELMEVTNGFSQQNILGEGGFGCVYKGWLPDGRVVAVKQLKAGSGQGEREFRAEVEIISRVHHRHLVSLVGYCIAEHHRLLVYEFVPNNTLEHHLHGKGMPVMDWAKRVKISVGAARGLAYLHEDCHPKIIHRDIKSANILLDDAFEAQVADFGLAKLSNDTHTHVSTRVMGTFGYMAPEYASSGKLTDRSDVFSFGVVLLELLTGRKPVDPTQPLGDESLVEWARPHLIHALETGDFEELVDPKLEKRYVESEMFRMIETAAACVRHSAPKRPRMVQVARSLDSEGDMPDLTNGVKFGQSTVFESRQSSSDIQRFRRMAFGSNDGSEYGMYSGENNSGEVPCRPPISWRPRDGSSEFSSGDLETQALNRRASERSFNEAHTNIGSRRFI